MAKGVFDIYLSNVNWGDNGRNCGEIEKLAFHLKIPSFL
jgi:hypothetical protein